MRIPIEELPVRNLPNLEAMESWRRMRRHIATAALEAMLASGQDGQRDECWPDPERAAVWALEYADALLTELAK